MIQTKYDNGIVADYWPKKETAKSTTSSFRTRAKTTPLTVNTQSLEISENMTFIIVNIQSHPKKNWVWILGTGLIPISKSGFIINALFNIPNPKFELISRNNPKYSGISTPKK